MGRITAHLNVTNPAAPHAIRQLTALVDTGSALTVLPSAWRDQFGEFESSASIEVEAADQRSVRAQVCGPARIEVEGFRPIYTEVAFIDMKPTDGKYEPLLGYIVLEQAGISIDTLGHRLVKAKPLDLK